MNLVIIKHTVQNKQQKKVDVEQRRFSRNSKNKGLHQNGS